MREGRIEKCVSSVYCCQRDVVLWPRRQRLVMFLPQDGDREEEHYSSFGLGYCLSVTCAPTLTWSRHYFLYLLSNINKVCFTHLKLSFDCFFVFVISVSLTAFIHGDVREKENSPS